MKKFVLLMMTVLMVFTATSCNPAVEQGNSGTGLKPMTEAVAESVAKSLASQNPTAEYSVKEGSENARAKFRQTLQELIIKPNSSSMYEIVPEEDKEAIVVTEAIDENNNYTCKVAWKLGNKENYSILFIQDKSTGAWSQVNTEDFTSPDDTCKKYSISEITYNGLPNAKADEVFKKTGLELPESIPMLQRWYDYDKVLDKDGKKEVTFTGAMYTYYFDDEETIAAAVNYSKNTASFKSEDPDLHVFVDYISPIPGHEVNLVGSEKPDHILIIRVAEPE